MIYFNVDRLCFSKCRFETPEQTSKHERTKDTEPLHQNRTFPSLALMSCQTSEQLGEGDLV